MSNVTVGTQTAIEQASSYGYQPGRGDYTRRRWRVSDPTDVGPLLTELRALGYAYDVTPSADGAVTDVEGRLDAEPSGDGGGPEAAVLSETWEREAQVSDKDILESDVAIISALTQAEKQIIKRELAQPEPGYTSTGLSADAFSVYQLMLTGVKTVRVYSPIIRRTRITANSYAVQYADSNVGRRLSTAQMTSLEGAPGNLLFSLPSYTKARTDNATIPLSYGFVKKPARITQQGDGRWQIVQEYDYDLWSTLLYAAAT